MFFNRGLIIFIELEPPTVIGRPIVKQAIKTGLESPTPPIKLIPYKNGIGIKKIEFIK